ncbi:MAG: cell division ATP-binding protein FtsE [Fibrobacterota bacterium]
MVEFVHVSKVYGNQYPALYDVSLRITKGEFVFLTGESGAGKTTLLKHIFLDEFPTHGQISLAGISLGGSSGYIPRKKIIQKMRRNMGIVFQDIRLLRDRTVLENISFAARITRTSERMIRKRSYDVLSRVGLAHKSRSYPDQLSGGEQQRVAVARAMVNDPEIFIADEPTGNLDIRISGEIFSLLQDIHNNGTTVIMATHERTFIERTHYREISLSRGSVVGDRKKIRRIHHNLFSPPPA